MSNKTELQANNVELQEILDSVNALPDAGGGGAAEVQVYRDSVSVASVSGNNKIIYTCSDLPFTPKAVYAVLTYGRLLTSQIAGKTIPLSCVGYGDGTTMDNYLFFQNSTAVSLGKGTGTGTDYSQILITTNGFTWSTTHANTFMPGDIADVKFIAIG